jgi:hypothetical protein
MLLPDRLDTEAVLRVGKVTTVTGRKIFISVDTDKNLSELFFDGDVLRNIAVGSYIDIRKRISQFDWQGRGRKRTW